MTRPEGRAYCQIRADDGIYTRIALRVDAAGCYHVLRPDDVPNERMRRQVETALRAEERRIAAIARSKELFTRLLTDDQRVSFESRGYIDVAAHSGRLYRINCQGGYSGNINWIPAPGQRGGSFCVYPHYLDYEHSLPKYDAFLGQMLLIATDERKFLNTGIFHGAVHPDDGPRRVRMFTRLFGWGRP